MSVGGHSKIIGKLALKFMALLHLLGLIFKIVGVGALKMV